MRPFGYVIDRTVLDITILAAVPDCLTEYEQK